jgi:CHAT domain-containing protein
MFSPVENPSIDIQRRSAAGEFAGYDWLHVATHAYADRATGVFTGLLLGDGIISLEDIREWDLHARLITLSACQSGLGRWYYGDEIAGLSQAFFRAGARNIVASLWRVEDNHTADLMQSFYGGLSQSSSPLEALVDAQRTAHEAGLDPYYWAPFTAFGAPD